MWRVLFLLFFGWSFVASGKPMSITFSDLQKAAEYIVVARYDGPLASGKGYQLQIERSLKGSLKPGAQTVLRSPDGEPEVKKGERCIAFLDDKLQFRWAALPGEKQGLDDGFLYIKGFYDFNAYLVSPSLITLAQLETFLSKGTLHYEFSGPLHFLSGGVSTPSTIVLSFGYDLAAKTTKVTGMPKLAGFTTDPEIYLTPGYDPDVTLSYDRNLSRSLIIAGRVESVDKKTGRYTLKLSPESPDLFTEAEFVRYLGDKKLGHPYFEIEVTLSTKEVYTMVIDREIGRIGELIDPKKKKFAASSFSLSPERELQFSGAETIKISLNKATSTPPFARVGTTGTLLQELNAGSITGELERGGVKTSCTLTLRKTLFTKL
jgi:hypothetical protein